MKKILFLFLFLFHKNIALSETVSVYYDKIFFPQNVSDKKLFYVYKVPYLYNVSKIDNFEEICKNYFINSSFIFHQYLNYSKYEIYCMYTTKFYIIKNQEDLIKIEKFNNLLKIFYFK